MNDAEGRDNTLGSFKQEPLIRLLAFNLAIGAGVAVLMFSGLLTFSPHRLRELILADEASLAALMLLLGGLLVTFGSAAMGTAIMAIGAQRFPRD